MRYLATMLALVIVATAAAAHEWRGTPSLEQRPIVLRPSGPPAETAATLLDLKRPPALTPPKEQAATTVAARRPRRPAPKAQPRRSVWVAAPAPRRPAVGAAPAPAPAPAPIPADEDNNDDDSGGEDDD
jgi:hypothetical protein